MGCHLVLKREPVDRPESGRGLYSEAAAPPAKLFSRGVFRNEKSLAAKLGSHPAYMGCPFWKTRLIFRTGRDYDRNALHGIQRHGKTGNHHFQIRAFKQIVSKRAEKRIEKAGFLMQSDNHISGRIFLDRMDDARTWD